MPSQPADLSFIFACFSISCKSSISFKLACLSVLFSGRIDGGVRPTTSVHDLFPSWLIRDSSEGLHGWICHIVNVSLKAGLFEGNCHSPIIKEREFRSRRPWLTLDWGLIFLWGGKVIEKVVALQLLQFLDETGCLDPFQSSCWPGCSTETTLVGDLKGDLERVPVGRP